MMIVRPITAEDHDALWEIAKITGPGFTSLQPDQNQVASKLEWAVNSFASHSGQHPVPDEALYLLVVEDTETGKVVGTSGIESAVGLNAPWYNYKVNKQVHASQNLNVYNMVETLMICNDHTGFSELCTLFLNPDYRHSRNGALLSKSRFMFLAAHPELFNEHIIAEMRGYSDDQGISPFWEALGRHFFSVDFVEADQQSSKDKAFIAELMPRHPIYTNLLTDAARDAIGKTHANTAPALKMLEKEGFQYTGYVDIFDAGPLIETRISDIRAVRDSRLYTVNIHNKTSDDKTPWLMASGGIRDFRCTIGALSFEGLETINITQQQADALQVDEGQSLRIVPLAAPATARR